MTQNKIDNYLFNMISSEWKNLQFKIKLDMHVTEKKLSKLINFAVCWLFCLWTLFSGRLRLLFKMGAQICFGAAGLKTIIVTQRGGVGEGGSVNSDCPKGRGGVNRPPGPLPQICYWTFQIAPAFCFLVKFHPTISSVFQPLKLTTWWLLDA